MSVADVVLSVSAMHEAALTALAIFLTVLSGYLVVAYSVGADLTKSQLIFINSIFIVFGLTLTLGVYTYLNAAYQFGLAHYPESETRTPLNVFQ